MDRTLVDRGIDDDLASVLCGFWVIASRVRRRVMVTGVVV